MQHGLGLFLVLILFFLRIPLPPRSTLFPYPALFRSHEPTAALPSVRSTHGRPCWVVRSCSRRRGPAPGSRRRSRRRSEEHTSELQSSQYLVCRLLLEKKLLLDQTQLVRISYNLPTVS